MMELKLAKKFNLSFCFAPYNSISLWRKRVLCARLVKSDPENMLWKKTKCSEVLVFGIMVYLCCSMFIRKNKSTALLVDTVRSTLNRTYMKRHNISGQDFSFAILFLWKFWLNPQCESCVNFHLFICPKSHGLFLLQFGMGLKDCETVF